MTEDIDQTLMRATYSLRNPALREFYRRRGFGGRVGFGVSPALLVIDLAKAWTSTESLLGADLSEVLQHTRRLLDDARAARVPVFFTTTAFDAALQERGSVINRKRSGRNLLSRGSEWVEICEEVAPLADEVTITKQRGSAFAGTTLVSQLIALRVDTIVIAGCATSGCVRATASDAHDLNYHVIVAQDAVGDRDPLAHEASLLDIDRSFGDVMTTSDVSAHLRSGLGPWTERFSHR